MSNAFKEVEVKKDLDLNVLWDVIIIGLGPCAYTAGIYSTRFNMNTLLIGEHHGGLVSDTPYIENYPGVDDVSGPELADLMRDQYLRLNGFIHQDLIRDVNLKEGIFTLIGDSGKIYRAKSVISATGLKTRTLELENEAKFTGRGVSYCATCDAAFFKNKRVVVVGGGDSAFTAAIHLSQFTDKNNLYLMHRKDTFRAQPSLVERLKGKAQFILDSQVKEINGDRVVREVVFKNLKTNEISSLKVDGIFVTIGHKSTADIFKNLNLNLSDEGYIVVDSAMKTNVDGFFAAGDCTNGMNNMKQIITACAMGALASESAYKYINKL